MDIFSTAAEAFKLSSGNVLTDLIAMAAALLVLLLPMGFFKRFIAKFTK